MASSKVRLLESLNSTNRVEGLTHNFYKYPARFSPEFAKEVILEFTKEGDCVLDTFMGGGTTVVEAIANGRIALGIDINPLSKFVACVKTTPLSTSDKDEILRWAESLEFKESGSNNSAIDDLRLRNLPTEIKRLLIHLVSTINQLEYPRQQRFARCALLKLGCWAIDCRKNIPPLNDWKRQLLKQIDEMFHGLNDLVEAAKSKNIPKNKITSQRLIFTGTIHEALKNRNFAKFLSKPKLLLTSPPYPGVHILYHRWQVSGRRETPAPFWLSNLCDGHGGSFYTLGSRSKFGLKNYFIKLTDIFWHLRQVINPNAFVIQLVAFSDPDTQVPFFLRSMHSAGYEELTPLKYSEEKRPMRKVPNRKWYAYSANKHSSSNEILFFHRPRKNSNLRIF